MSCSTPVRSTGTPRPASRRVASRIVGVETVSGRRAGASRLLSPGRRGSRFAGGGNFPWRNSLKSQETRKLSTRPLSPATWPRTRRCIGLDCSLAMTSWSGGEFEWILSNRDVWRPRTRLPRPRSFASPSPNRGGYGPAVFGAARDGRDRRGQTRIRRRRRPGIRGSADRRRALDAGR
jgi:hypothetical protein